MSTNPIEYVSSSDTIADIALNEGASASLRTSTSIVLALILISAAVLNLMLIASIMTGRKLRSSIFHRLLCHLSAINIVDLGFTVFLSLLYVANGVWSFGMAVCRMNTVMKQFCQLYTMLSLVVMGTERAIKLSQFSYHLMSNKRVLRLLGFMVYLSVPVMQLVMLVVAIASTVPTTFNAIPVKPFIFQYICAIDDGSPLLYSIFQLIVHVGCVVGLVVCAASIFAKRQELNIPSQAHEYSEFITRTRALQEAKSLGKLTVALAVFFILLEGPYITLCFLTQIRNSRELLQSLGPLPIPQDADTLITWLKFLFPLLSPILVFSWCSEVWSQVLEVFCCKSSEPPTIGQFIANEKGNFVGSGQVMTLVATPNGLQLKMPSYAQYNNGPVEELLDQAPPYNETLEPSLMLDQSPHLNARELRADHLTTDQNGEGFGNYRELDTAPSAAVSSRTRASNKTDRRNSPSETTCDGTSSEASSSLTTARNAAAQKKGKIIAKKKQQIRKKPKQKEPARWK